MVYGSNKVHNVALIVVAQEALQKYAQREGISEIGNALLENATIQGLFDDEIRNNSGSFRGFEIPKRFRLLAEEWTVENGLLTPTMKLKRSIVEKQFANDLESLYG
jgi:long-chain acyl-CoA synthetase